MKLDKAIEILIAYKAGQYEDTGGDLDDALELGIEALKAIVVWRKNARQQQLRILPGETKD